VRVRAASGLAVLLTACGGGTTPTDGSPPGDATSASQSKTGPLAFVDATAASGLAFLHDAGLTPEKHLPETMGAGAALVDVDRDGDLDLYFVQSGPLPFDVDRGASPKNELWINDGSGHFIDASAKSGAAAHAGYGMGVAAGDVNGDGHVDLFVTNLGPDVLLLGDGTGAFTDATAAAGLGDPRWTAGATFFDADGDSDLDLYVTGYLEYDLSNPEFCGKREPGWRSYCHPDLYPGLQDRFYRNRGDGTFEERTEAAGLADSLGKGLGAAAFDADDDGDLDLYVANDSVENRLWINAGDGTFTDGTLLSGTGVNGQGLTEAGMGIATGDLDGDGRADLYVTNFDDESNTYYRNDGDGLFTDATARAGLEAASRLPVGFGTVAADLDGDGDLDLAVANGHIIDNIHLYNDGKRWAQRALLFENDGSGHFRNATDEAGDFASAPLVGRGLYAGDLDGDGDLDLLQTECNGAARLYRKAGAPAAAPAVLVGLPPGARVRVAFADGRTIVREAGPAISYFGAGSSAVQIFGEEPPETLELRLPGHDWRTVAVPGSGRTLVEATDGQVRLRPQPPAVDSPR